ncbi:MAG: transposase [Clostridium sp.]|nr:transposase [Clostridium sp.]
MNILQTIFKEHYEEMYYLLHPRKTVVDNVDRMLICGDSSQGGAFYGCPHCGQLKFVPYTCKSRFCPSCGNLYNQKRSFHMSSKLISCVHRHCVFTIPEELRGFFLRDRSLLGCLFHAVRSSVLRMFSKMNKAENFTPGFICVLHTFGRDLKWNPHIHALISEGGVGNITTWRIVKHFNYHFLRNSFRKVLLELMEKNIGPSFRKTKKQMYTLHSEGFYVRAMPNPCPADKAITYVTRYLGRPVIATSRIDKYDGDFVTFHYTRHEDDKLVTETVPVLDFIKRLIVHIPEKHFKMLRYYGIYAKHHKQEKKLYKCLSKEKLRFLRSTLDWRNSIIVSFGYDPLRCPKCGTSMLVLEVYHKKTALFEQYRKAMGYG